MHAKDLLRRYWPLVTVLLLLIAALIRALATGAFFVNATEAPKPGALRPGDANYPSPTENPVRVIQLLGSGLDLTNMSFAAIYVSDYKLCNFKVGLGVYSEYRLGSPIEMVRSGNSYRGTIEIDKFVPGHCGWHFERVDGQADGNSLQLASIAPGSSLPSAAVPMDYWCFTIVSEQKPTKKCESMATLRWPNSVRLISTEFFSRFGAFEQNDDAQRTILAETDEIRINLRDLNAIPGALVSADNLALRSEMEAAAGEAARAPPKAMARECLQSATDDYAKSHGKELVDPRLKQEQIRTLTNKCLKDLRLAVRGIGPMSSEQWPGFLKELE
jgi:outer membrane murein-binding lipoprotein Lpp